MFRAIRNHVAGVVTIAIVAAAVAGIAFAYRNATVEERERSALRSTGIVPVAVLDRTEFDWGEIGRDAVVEQSFTLRNEGNADLTVTFLATSCSCTTADLLLGGPVPSGVGGAVTTIPATIPPGESGIIRVTFDPAAHEARGETERAVRIETNDPDNPFLVITLRAYVR